MRKKKYNTIQDLLEDQSFNDWALNPESSDAVDWELWLKEAPTNEVLAAEAKDIIIGINFKKEIVSEDKVNTEWDKLADKIQNLEDKKSSQQEKDRKRLVNVKYLSIAATLLLLVSLSVFTYSLFSTVTHKTTYGEMLNVVLEDGSVVTLNSNSSISYTNFNPRSIELSGEAFFKVKKDLVSKAKFRVKTKDLTVEVFGTQFNVKTLQNKTNVFLEEGSIMLNLNNGNEQKMIPGNYIEYSSSESKILVNKNNTLGDQHVSWKSGNLIFENTNLEEALIKIAENYGVEFKHHSTETKEILITGKVPTTNLEICLNAIKKSTNIKIQKENGILVVYKN
ncbi:FecR family protein [Tenacibaculum sp. 190524A05c]|uniref:FecR family protein n=1 Tax=Tenacibaculum platacis TaxID=3137852 RepID=UPI0032B1AD7C